MHAYQEVAQDTARLKAEGLAMLAELAADIEARMAPTPRVEYAAAVAAADAQLWAAIDEGLGRDHT